jgi:uroporphyrinogen-III synthase
VQTECSLNDAGVLVTRAEHQAQGLCRLITRYNGRALRFPAVTILEPQDPGVPAELMREISAYQVIIFISPNAVEWGLRLLPDGIPGTLEIGAVGRSTAQALAESGYPVDIVPQDRFDSEALLETPALRSVEGKRILVVRGVGGRPLLGDTLSERGAEVTYAEVYRRQCPQTDPSLLLDRWSEQVDVVTATSNDILDNLYAMLGERGRELLLSTPLIVISDRMRSHARELGFSQVILASGAEDQTVVQTLCAWAAHMR